MLIKYISTLKKFLLDILFPCFCLNCKKQGTYLCQDCQALIEILEYQFCPVCDRIAMNGKTCNSCQKKTNLEGLYFAISYSHPLAKKIIHQFKYQPFIKELAQPLANLIINHFLILNKDINWTQFKLVSIPLNKKKIRWRGFNQSQEITQYISRFFKVPILNNALVRSKTNIPQIKIKDFNVRKENIKGVFSCQNPEIIKNQKILLVDDVFTTGATMEEGAQVLKKAGAKEVWGIVIARG